jgi:hypothetical protein
MYQWQGDAPLMTNGGPRQGKDRGGVNSYCIQCHGYENEDDFYEVHEEHVQERNIDCARCHNFSRD